MPINKEQNRIVDLAAKHKEALQALGTQLAVNTAVPANRLINSALVHLGITRVDYEKIKAHNAGTAYVAVPKHLLARWASQ